MIRNFKNLDGLLLLTMGIVLIGTAGPSKTTPASEPPQNPNPYALQISHDVHEALQKNADAHSYQEWATSGFMPEDIFQNVRALNSPLARESLCSSLSGLTPENLALFENQILKKHLACSRKLLRKIRSYWSQANDALASGEIPSAKLPIDTARGPVLSNGELKPGQIALTFDGGPDAKFTPQILSILNKAGVRATFFDVGKKAQALPDIAEQTARLRNTVGSLSWDALDLSKSDLKQAEQEITAGRDAVAAASGTRSDFFRFPMGSKNIELQNFVRDQGMATFFWNMDSQDWKIRDPNRLLQHILDELDREKGGILLLHDTLPQTVVILPSLLNELKARSYTTYVFVPH